MTIREIFLPKNRIPVISQPIIDEYRELYSGKKDIYLSVYTYTGYDKDSITPQNAIVDKIFLDFDYDEDLKFFDDVRTVAKFLYEMDMIFKIRFSGRGFHIFIELDINKKLKNPRQCIRNWVKELHEKTNTTSDKAVIGDLRRVSRMLGTMNMKTHLYCIPLEYAHLMNFTYDAICDMAKVWKPIYNNGDKLSGLQEWIEGKNLLDISEYDTDDMQPSIGYINTNKIQIKEDFPPCIKEMLKNPELGYYERGLLICYLRDDGYSFYEILTILKTTLSQKKYYHCTEEENQPQYLYYDREDMLFASCQTLKHNGLCPSNKCCGQWLYL